jgi:hypothetical protein
MSPGKWVLGRRLRHCYRWRFDSSDRSPILELDPHGEIVAIDIERDVDILRMQIRSGRIMKAPDFAAREDQATNGVGITRSSLGAVPKMDRA